jgi:hypothetical protein
VTTDDIIAYCGRKRYSLAYTRYWTDAMYCEVPGCGSLAEAPHHIRTRGAGGKDDAGNLLALCVMHHMQVHTEGAETFATRYPSLAGKIRAAREAKKVVDKPGKCGTVRGEG